MKPVTLQNRSTLPQVVGWFGLECFWTTPSRRSSAWKPLMVSRPARPPANRLVVGRRSSLAGSQLCAHSARLSSPRLGSRHVAVASATSISAFLRSASTNRALVSLWCFPRGVAVTHLVVHNGTGSTGGIAPLNATPLNVRHITSGACRLGCRATPRRLLCGI
jgi:hypothetical protein